jgi:hypothetical protein
MTERAVVEVKQPSAVAPWAPREDVRELAERLQSMIPGGQKLTQVEALTLAQAAVAHGLDPFNGELWFLKDKHGKPMGLMAGIKGHRRSAHRQMREEGGGNYWPEFEGPMSVDEKAALGIPKDALAYRCKIRDTQTVNAYVNEIERLMATGLPWEVVESIVGKKPFTEGIGYAQPSERSKMTLVQRAQKRAEADALKRRFDLPFGVAVGLNGDNVVEGEFVVEEDNAPRISQEAQDTAEAEWSEETFDAGEDGAIPTNWHQFHPKAIRDLKYNHLNHVINTLRQKWPQSQYKLWMADGTITPEPGVAAMWAHLKAHQEAKQEAAAE